MEHQVEKACDSCGRLRRDQVNIDKDERENRGKEHDEV
jgi:hypothetical protein